MKYTLKGQGEVTPVDGETLPSPQPGLSHGFQHFFRSDGTVGFCGIFFWEENAVESNDTASVNT